MDSIYLSVDKIISHKTQQGQYLFKVRVKNPAFDILLPLEKLPDATETLIIKYCLELIPELSKRKRIERSCREIYSLLATCKKTEFDLFVKQFVSVSGFELPCSKNNDILKQLKSMISQDAPSEEALKIIRREILLEKIIVKREEQLLNLKRAEIQINVISNNKQYIKISNDVDLEEFPSYLRYVNKYILTSDKIPKEVPIGCDCQNTCSSSCAHLVFELDFQRCDATKVTEEKDLVHIMPYDENGKIVRTHVYPIYECNDLCKCDESCPRRIVQKGPNVKLEIFRTFNGCGWGVRTLENIPRGTFVSKYAGELIPWDEGNSKDRSQEYLFDIDVNVNPTIGHATYTTDAFKYGNISRFINHSCSPNLSVRVVFINNVHLEMAEIAFFAHRDILANQELTINYNKLVRKNSCRCAYCQ